MINQREPRHMKGARRSLLAKTAAVVALGLGSVAQAQATETVNLNILSGFPPAAAVVKVLQESFMPNVDAALAETGNYQINWQESFSGTLAAPGGELEALQFGLADVAVIVTPFHPDRLPHYQIGYSTPFTTTDMVLVHQVVDEIAERFPVFEETWRRLNQVSLSASGVADNYVICSTRPISSPADLEGMRIGGIGPNLRWVEPLGAVGVTATLAEWYNMADTGVIDAMLAWGESVVSMRYYEVCPYYWNAGLGGANTYVINVNLDVWNRLPEEVQGAMTTAARQYGVDLGQYVGELAARAEALFVESGGTVSEIDEGQRNEWAQALPNLAIEWADALEAEGVPGHEILSHYMNAMRAADQPIARQWDQ